VNGQMRRGAWVSAAMLVLPSETGGAQVVVLDAEATLGLGWRGGVGS
jgi:hypothetical protein